MKPSLLWDARHSASEVRLPSIGRLPRSAKIGKLPMGAFAAGLKAVLSRFFGLEAVLGRPNADLMP
jgi:hypothetical protein